MTWSDSTSLDSKLCKFGFVIVNFSLLPTSRKKQEECEFKNVVAKCVGFLQIDCLIKMDELYGKKSTSQCGEDTKDCCEN